MQPERQNHGIQITPASFTPRTLGSAAAATVAIMPPRLARLTSSTTMGGVPATTPLAWPCCQLPTRQTYVCLVVARRKLAP